MVKLHHKNTVSRGDVITAGALQVENDATTPVVMLFSSTGRASVVALQPADQGADHHAGAAGVAVRFR
jgi:hypothetical protein